MKRSDILLEVIFYGTENINIWNNKEIVSHIETYIMEQERIFIMMVFACVVLTICLTTGYSMCSVCLCV